MAHQPTNEPRPLTYEATAAAAAARPRASLLLLVLASLAVVTALYFARDLLIPLVLACLLTLLLRPILRRMRRLHLPDAVSALILIGAVVIVFVLGVLMLARQANSWLVQAPKTVQRVSAMLPATGPLQRIQEMSAALEDLATTDGNPPPVEVEMKSADLAYRVLGVSGHVLAAATIVFVLGYFLLAFSEGLLRQAIASRSSFGQKRNVVNVLYEVESGISRYLLTITAINSGLGIATGAALWLLGVPNPVLWGVLVAAGNFVPHVGAMVCMIVLFFVGAVSHESLAYGLLVASVFVALTSVESYFLTPLVLSRSLRLSPLAVILAILFWGWLWGIAGGLMAAPLLTVIKIVCDQFASLRTVSGLLAGATPSSNGAASVEPLAGASQPAA
jgi:predicted PurR-regulated permease PerM